MPFIDIIEPENANDRLKDIYIDLERSRGKIAEVHKIQSLNPELLISHMDLYSALMYGQSPLKRAQREMLGVVVSVSNECDYCQVHHAKALMHFWKDEEKINMLISDYHLVDLNDTDKLLCDYARELTKHPGGKWEKDSFINPLKESGLSDRAILDATAIISYFNFINRIVLALGLDLENDPGGYKYE